MNAASQDSRREPGSFRDPSGFLFWQEGVLYRQVNAAGAEDYDLLMRSGLFDELAGKGLLVGHTADHLSKSPDRKAIHIIRPEIIPYISYSYEWCFEQYRDAALLTLDIAFRALEKGMILKDGSAYNVQFRGGRPVFIDTLSFAAYRQGQPWAAYGQFCRHFLAPLLLMSGVSPGFAKNMALHLDGIPLDFAAAVLRGKWKWRPSVYLHLYLHARNVTNVIAGKKLPEISIALASVRNLIANLRKLIAGLRPAAGGTEWESYYDTMLNYSDEAFTSKGELVASFLDACAPGSVCDLGANRGEFSKHAARRNGSHVVAYDIDHTAVNQHYLYAKTKGIDNILPLVIDLTNPSPALGWANEERDSLLGRAGFDCVMSLALVHHLAIANNVPLGRIADFFSRMGRHLIIEFVPKQDSQSQRLLQNREDIFDEYTQSGFEAAFSRHFVLMKKASIRGSQRTLYLYKGKNTKETDGTP